MKRITGLIAFLIISIAPSFAQAKKDITTEKIRVNGTCGACKKRIEAAAYSPGVKLAEWDKTTKELTVTYRPSKTSLEKIEADIIATGHDAGEQKASDSSYQSLPPCCAYKDEHAHSH